MSVSDVELGTSNHREDASSAPAAAVVRRVALLMDGMARAAILPFGPRLVHRLTYDKELQPPTSDLLEVSPWSQIAYPFAIVTATYALGRALGMAMTKQFPVAPSRLSQQVARLGGLSLALHLFAFGAGLDSVRWLVCIRFVSGLLAGYACASTNCTLPEDKVHVVVQEDVSDDELMEEGSLDSSERSSRMRKRAGYVNNAPGTTKVYMTGVAISILTGGLLYKKVSHSVAMQAYTGGETFTFALVFFVTLWLLVEYVLRLVFSFTTPSSHHLGSSSLYSHAAATPRKMKRGGGAVNHLVRHVVSRRVKTALSPIPSWDQDDHDDGLMTAGTDPPGQQLPRQSDHSSSSHSFTPNRARVDSARSETSLHEFFDCNSAFSDEVIDLDADPLTGDACDYDRSSMETDVAVYENHKSLYADGSPAFVPPGDCIAKIPPQYLESCGRNEAKARKMWNATQQWRREKDVWRIHTLPHALFKDIKAAYPHFIHGHSKKGHPIIYEQPGRMQVKEFFREKGEIADMVKHYTFMMEFIANCIVKRDDIRRQSGNTCEPFDPHIWGTMVVMDVKGATVTSLSGDVIKYLTQAGEINNCHYPLRLKRAFVVNSPFWLAGVWSSIRGILPESVHVEILSASKFLNCLREFIDDDQIPREYGGSSPYPLDQHPYELALNEMVSKATDFSHTEELPQAAERVAPEVVPIPSGTFYSNDTDLLIHRETPMSPIKPPTSLPLRRRSTDRFPSTIAEEYYEGEGGMEFSGQEQDVLWIVSVMYAVWCCVQGAIEVSLPLWVLSPGVLGGLGYAPSRSGVAMFSASVVLLWIMRTKIVWMIAQLPSKEPMRAFRVGVGSEAVLLTLLPLVPHYATSVARTESILIMTSTIIFLSCMAVASMLGRSAATIMHRTAAESFSRMPSGGMSRFAQVYGRDRLLSDCESGKFTSMLRLFGETAGIVSVAPLFCWSTLHHRPFPFDASCCFYAASLVASVLYVSSFSLHLNSAGNFSPHPKDGCGDVDTKKCCSFAGEVFTVVVGDMASLFEEDNWSSSPLLGYSNARGTKDKHAGKTSPTEPCPSGHGIKSI